MNRAVPEVARLVRVAIGVCFGNRGATAIYVQVVDQDDRRAGRQPRVETSQELLSFRLGDMREPEARESGIERPGSQRQGIGITSDKCCVSRCHPSSGNFDGFERSVDSNNACRRSR